MKNAKPLSLPKATQVPVKSPPYFSLPDVLGSGAFVERMVTAERTSGLFIKGLKS